MSGTVHTARVFTPEDGDDGHPIGASIRILAVQRKWPPVRPSVYDRWMPELAPSAQLRADVAIVRRKMSLDEIWTMYAPAFEREMETRADSKKGFADVRELLAEGKDVTLLCYCKDGTRCHRAILRRML